MKPKMIERMKNYHGHERPKLLIRVQAEGKEGSTQGILKHPCQPAVLAKPKGSL